MQSSNGTSWLERLHDEREVEELWRSLRNDALRRGADVHTAEDVAQEAWLRVMRSEPDERGRLRGWLHVVARRFLLETRLVAGNRRQRERVAARPEPVASRTGDEESTLLRYVDELPDTYRTVIHLRFVEDRGVAEIAELMELEPSAVRSRLDRGLARLRVRVGAPVESRAARSSAERRSWAALVGLPGFLRRGSARRLVWASGLAALVLLSAAVLWTTPRTRASTHDELAPAVALASDAALADDGRAEREPLRPAPGSSVVVESSRVHLAGWVRAASGQPIPGAQVHAAAPDGSGEVLARADEQGRYALDAGGQDLVWATHSEHLDSARSRVVSVERPGTFDLFFAPTRGRTRVLVLDPDGVPLSGAEVRVNPFETGDQVVSARGTLEVPAPPPRATTDAQGRAELLLPEQSWVELAALAPGLAAWHGELPTPAPGDALTITLPRPALVQGVVRTEGSPCWNARVEVLQLGGLVQREARTEADGSFAIAALAPGEFLVRAVEDPHSGHASLRTNGVLAEGATLDLPLVLEERYSIHGRVLDGGRPAPGVHLSLFNWTNHVAGGSSVQEVLTDEHGEFVFAGCRPGLQRLLAQIAGNLGEFQERIVRPGDDVEIELRSAGARLAPIELEFVGEPASLPRVIELRKEPGLSLIVEPEPASGRFRSPPLPAGEFCVYAWTAELGTWSQPQLRHDPEHGGVQRIVVPRGSPLLVGLDLPRGVAPGSVEVLIFDQAFHNGFDLYGPGPVGNRHTRRDLVWNGARGLYEGSFPPGRYSLVVRGAGLAECYQILRLAEGAETRVECAPQLGVETQLVFHSPRRSLIAWEKMYLDAETPTGTVHLELRAREQGPRECGFAFHAWLPATATALRVHSEFARGDPSPTLHGEREIVAGELDPGSGTPRLDVDLVLRRGD